VAFSGTWIEPLGLNPPEYTEWSQKIFAAEPSSRLRNISSIFFSRAASRRALQPPLSHWKSHVLCSTDNAQIGPTDSNRGPYAQPELCGNFMSRLPLQSVTSGRNQSEIGSGDLTSLLLAAAAVAFTNIFVQWRPSGDPEISQICYFLIEKPEVYIRLFRW